MGDSATQIRSPGATDTAKTPPRGRYLPLLGGAAAFVLVYRALKPAADWLT